MALSIPRRLLTTRLIILGVLTTFILAIYTYLSYSPLPQLDFLAPNTHTSCSPEAWSRGQWMPKRDPSNFPPMTRREDAFAFSGFEGCASDREIFWHLASDREEQWDRFPGAQSWEWIPGKGCNARPLNKEEMVKDMVEQGGWLLLGGESLSFLQVCMLIITYPPYRLHHRRAILLAVVHSIPACSCHAKLYRKSVLRASLAAAFVPQPFVASPS
jgi:hypothetical protein